MMATTSPLPSRPRVLGSIRNAEPRDAAELARLLQTTRHKVTPAGVEREREHLLVFELEGVLRAASYVEIDARRSHARIHLLAVDTGLGSARREVEDRMLGVARSLCDAYACTGIEIASPSDPSSA
jgi:hypothetical protein